MTEQAPITDDKYALLQQAERGELITVDHANFTPVAEMTQSGWLAATAKEGEPAIAEITDAGKAARLAETNRRLGVSAE